MNTARIIRTLFESEEHSDVTIIAEEQEFHVHSLVLKMASNVWKAALAIDMIEAQTHVIKVDDCRADMMRIALSYIYGYEFQENISMEDTFELYFLADKYMIDPLKYQCIQYMMKAFINVASCPKMISHESFLHLPEIIKHSCYGILKKNCEKIFEAPDTLEMSEETLLEVLDLEGFHVNTEIHMVNFAEAWVLHRIGDNVKNKDRRFRTIIEKKILPKLRFLTLTQVEFADKFCVSGNWLSIDERNEIYNAIKFPGRPVPDTFPAKISQSTKFRFLKRRFLETPFTINLLHYVPSPDCMCISQCYFRLNLLRGQNIKVLGFELLDLKKQTTQVISDLTNFDVLIHFYDDDNVNSERIATVKYRNNVSPKTCWFDDPYILENDCDYTIKYNYHCHERLFFFSNNCQQMINTSDLQLNVYGTLGIVSGVILQRVV